MSGGAERAASRGSQLTSAREIQPGTALGIGVALPSAVTLLHTPDWLYLTAFIPRIRPRTDQFCVEGYFDEIFSDRGISPQVIDATPRGLGEEMQKIRVFFFLLCAPESGVEKESVLALPSMALESVFLSCWF